VGEEPGAVVTSTVYVVGGGGDGDDDGGGGVSHLHESMKGAERHIPSGGNQQLGWAS